MSRNPADPPPDLVDKAMELPFVGSAATRLQRVAGPSCFLSLVLAAFILLWVRRYVGLPLPVMALLALMIWVGVLSVLVRLRNPNPDGDELSDPLNDRGA